MASQTAVDTQDTELHEADWRLHWNSALLSSLLNDPSTHDVTFKTSDGGSVSAHKAIIAASSPVFYNKFYIPNNPLTLESANIAVEGVDINVDAATLSKLLTFIYTGKVMVNSTCLDKMLHAACCYELISLETILMKFAESSLNVKNVISVAILASNRNCDQLQKCCQNFIGANIKKVARHPNFMALPHTVVLEVCKSSDLNVGEIDLFLAVAEWHKHQTLSKIASDDLLHKVRPTNLADSNLYKAALEYHLDSRIYEGPSNQLENRKHQLKLLSANESVSTTGMFMVLNIVCNCWQFYTLQGIKNCD